MMMLNTPTPGLPIGAMIAYAGLLADIPTGWHICDGTNGTPDLTDSFVMGGTQAQNGQTGGSNNVTPSGSVNVSVNNHTLSNSQMPSHNHGYNAPANNGGGNAYDSSASLNNDPYWTGTSHSGGSGGHSHGASGTLNANSQDNRPKFYKSAYIMRVS